MVSLLESLCTLSGHRCGPLCAWVVRQDGWWRVTRYASQRHREMRARFEKGPENLPFPPVASTLSNEQFESSERRFTIKSA